MHSSPRAKINLTLSVGPRAADGYHPLESVFLRVGLSDNLTVAFADDGPDVLTVSGLPGCPVEGNLVLRAFAAVRRAVGQDLPPLAAHLVKNIPMGAGLGGGSSDGAAAIEAAEVMWGIGMSPQLRADVELELGADVPFFARGGKAALVSGRGEQVERLPAPASDIGILLVTPPFGVRTSQAFARFDELESVGPRAPQPRDLDAIVANPELLREANDLWAAAASLAPDLAVLREFLERETKSVWLLTGSGSTLFAVYPSVAEASAEGRLLVSAESELLAGAMINAVDLIGPDPHWRYP